MSREQYGKQFGKILAAIALLTMTFIGLTYGSLLRDMDQAAQDYNQGDPEAAISY